MSNKTAKAGAKLGGTLAGAGIGLALAIPTGGLSIPAGLAIGSSLGSMAGQGAASFINDDKPIQSHSLAIAPGNPMNSYSPIQTDKGYNVTEELRDNTKGQLLDVGADVFGSLASIAGNALASSPTTPTTASGVTSPSLNLSKGLGKSPSLTQTGALYKSSLNKTSFQSNFNK